ncbi:DMT family transporter [Flavobacterium kingsejongi]|uniref:Guanidinium exporter n=1 Tax=Flavobacterium kingsejongi TaxID=1678728 RepID=A0A2S1LSK5_9FLAO|nr:multidrug efflux SMR transporter [Flavobacterium kingsejongi]AWG26641.1 QacE family quaternary ammonium compound efflux SMR transporter [Flavobacterium kingsejongi]
MNWIYLIIAGILEIGFTTSMKLSNNFTNLKWTIIFIICIVMSFYFVNKACLTLPLGTAYAVWTGIGAVGTVLVGIFYFNEPANFWRVFFIATLIMSILGLKFLGEQSA